MTGPEHSACHEVRAELVSTVLSVSAAVGDSVRPGTMVCLLESMKMEIPVLSEVTGVLLVAAVAKGQVVRCGDLLAIIETRPDAQPERRTTGFHDVRSSS